MKLSSHEINQYKILQSSPVSFVEKVWGLRLQPIKQEYLAELYRIAKLEHEEWEEQKHLIQAHWFGDYDTEANCYNWLKFEKGKHITWQQWLILISMEKALHSKAPKTISVASGRGIGKSATISWTLLWFLFSYPDCQIPCTAPGFQQMYDVLWKEIALWIHRMPPQIKKQYQWESSHIRITESPYTWFARAKTASKENPEALSGVHAEYVLALVDEASAVSDPIFEAAQGIFSSPNAYLLMISNPTQRNGYFFRSHHQSKSQWQCLQFCSTESPLVDNELVARYADEGTESDKYRINVQGIFPKEDAIDGKSYMQLIQESSIRMERPKELRFRDPILGVDPAGEGANFTSYCIRDNFFAEIVGNEETSTPKGIAQSVMTLAEKYKVSQKNIVVDSFGAGADVGKELALAVKWNVTTVNVAEKSEDDRDKEQFVNKRAEMYWKLKQWLEKGGILVEDRKLKEELLTIRFRRTDAGGKIQIMPKKEMRQAGIPSPDRADALAMTFLRKPGTSMVAQAQAAVLAAAPFDRWSM